MKAIILTAVFFLILYIIYYLNNNKTLNEKSSTLKEKSTPQNKPFTNETYSKKEIKEFNLKGILYSTEKKIGFFTGTAQSIIHPSDKYCVEILTNSGKHLAYTPKSNARLHTSIKEWHSGIVKCWGYVTYDDYKNTWTGTVKIPTGLTNEQISEIFNLIEILSILEAATKNDDLVIRSLKDFAKAESIMKKYPKSDIFVYYPLNILPGFSKRMEATKNWGAILELEAFDNIINLHAEKLQNSIRQRITKAKLNLT